MDQTFRPGAKPQAKLDANAGGKTLTRADLSEVVYATIGTTRTEAAKLVDLVLATIGDKICEGETVKLHNFGKFVVREKAKREGRNPRTMEPAEISERRIVQFKPSPAFKEKLNGGSKEG